MSFVEKGERRKFEAETSHSWEISLFEVVGLYSSQLKEILSDK